MKFFTFRITSEEHATGRQSLFSRHVTLALGASLPLLQGVYCCSHLIPSLPCVLPGKTGSWSSWREANLLNRTTSQYGRCVRMGDKHKLYGSAAHQFPEEC